MLDRSKELALLTEYFDKTVTCPNIVFIPPSNEDIEKKQSFDSFLQAIPKDFLQDSVNSENAARKCLNDIQSNIVSSFQPYLKIGVEPIQPPFENNYFFGSEYPHQLALLKQYHDEKANPTVDETSTPSYEKKLLDTICRNIPSNSFQNLIYSSYDSFNEKYDLDNNNDHRALFTKGIQSIIKQYHENEVAKTKAQARKSTFLFCMWLVTIPFANYIIITEYKNFQKDKLIRVLI